MLQEKYLDILEVASQIQKKVVSNEEEWKKFIKTAARFNKYHVTDQLLIYAQKPDAKACATFEIWNKNLQCYVKRGTKGIALLNPDMQSIRYVFDISDVGAGLKGKLPSLWKYEKEYEENIKNALENEFKYKSNTDFLGYIKELATKIVNENYEDTVTEIYKYVKGSLLEGLDNHSIEVIFKDLVSSSITYGILSRCDVPESEFKHLIDLTGIINFNTMPLTAAIGSAVQQFSAPIFNMVIRQVRKIEQEKGREENEINIQERRRLSNTKYKSEEAERTFDRKVRENETGVSITREERTVFNNDAARRVSTTSVRSGSQSRGNDGTSNGKIEEGEKYNRRNEVTKSDEMGTRYEYNSLDSGGNSTSGDYTQLTLFTSFPSEEQQKEVIKESNKQYTYIRPKQEKVCPLEYVEKVISNGTGFTNGKYRVIDLYNDKHTAFERARFIGYEYGCGGVGIPLKGDGFHGYQTDSKGVNINWRNNDIERTTLVKWSVIEDLIHKKIKQNTYLNEKENEKYKQINENRKLIESLRVGDKIHTATAIYEVKEIANTITIEIKKNKEDRLNPYEVSSYINRILLNKDKIVYADVLEIERGKDNNKVIDEYYSNDSEIAFYNKSNEQYYSISSSGDGYMYSIYDNNLNLIDGNIYEFKNDFDNIRDFAYTILRIGREDAAEISFDELFERINENKQKEDRAVYNEEVIVTKDDIQTENRKDETSELEEKKDLVKENAENYIIRDKKINYSLKERYENNILAIRTLKLIEKENRIATLDEQEVLSKYVGWGGLAQAFDYNNDKWLNEYGKLRSILTSAEYDSARSSTLNAHYTSPEIIQSVYKALGNMGFKDGTILEPALGIGNFFGMIPEEMKKSKLYGVEIDDLTGRIAKKLYPNSNIYINGFENTNFENNTFDVVIGNVPFGNYKINDPAYNKQNFLIHDYFFAKSIDKVRPGGIVAFITSKGTMDKQNSEVRRYLAERADLLGAIRLPNNAFRDNAGTEVTTDIIFLQKKYQIEISNADWIHLGLDNNGIAINQYFIEHPDMIMGTMKMVSGKYGMESTCSSNGIALEEQLSKAIEKLAGKYEPINDVDREHQVASETVIANPEVKNYSYTVQNDEIYYREDTVMYKCDLNNETKKRIQGLIEIREITRELIFNQLNESSSTEIELNQKNLNKAYDKFTEKYGIINSKINKRLFSKDSSYYLLCSLEVLDENGQLVRKADMFKKRTIKMVSSVHTVDTATEALALSISNKAKIDLPYMMEKITNRPTEEEIIKDLRGVIFKNPKTDAWETQDEYLSGNVRKKLKEAEEIAKIDTSFEINVERLKQVQPKELLATEIEVRMGATWIDESYIREFIYETLKPPKYLMKPGLIDVNYSKINGLWNVSGKNANSTNVIATVNYGTKRANAYRIIEDTLNLKDVKIFDTVVENGKQIRILNKNETMLAQQKQDLIKEAFKDWIFKEPKRREELCKKYNELFNSLRPREYDGSHLEFPGMNPEITLKPNQKNAVARALYSGNALFAHAVGAGKTFAMAATCMEGKRLGISHKSLCIVPKSLVGQWTNDFLTLYPGANLLVSTAKDFEPANRKKFCSKIATGDYDAIIISHSQFDKIPLSKERQRKYINQQIEEITTALESSKNEKGEKFTVKQMELTRKALVTKLDKLNTSVKKDNVISFEELGVDRIFVDEAHNYKNLYLYTKMNNVAGISQTEAEKSTDMYNKCKYLDEITNGKGIIFATGTPISNSMTELYTMMRYLQYDTLKDLGLTHFDSWASTFGETVTAMELTVEGNSYRTKTRFSKFYNLPELMNIFKEVADIQTADMLKLPIPEVEYVTDIQKPSEEQKEILKSIVIRAEKIRNGTVDPTEDNMLKITNDGKKLALDQRLINNMLNDKEGSKVNSCVKNVVDIWNCTKSTKLTQMIFCDLSTPSRKVFNVYDDIKSKLINEGIPEKEIAFIHDASTDIKKIELFTKVRQGKVRILLGSTQKLGTGTNVQDKLVAEHHLDPPWRPSDIEQREGRILRQGNQNEKVKIFRYVTEGTFDAYSWQMLENKQKFIGQIMTSKSPVRSCSDVDESVLSYAEVKALATGNPYIKEKMDLDVQVNKLKLLKANYTSQIYTLQDNIVIYIPKRIAELEEKKNGYQEDIRLAQTHKNDDFRIKLSGIEYTEKKEAGEKIIEICKESKNENLKYIGEYKGFKLKIIYDPFDNEFKLRIQNRLTQEVNIGTDPVGNITKINNCLEALEKRLAICEEQLDELQVQLEQSKIEVEKPFSLEKELTEKMLRLSELNTLLSENEESSGIAIKVENIENDIVKNGFKKNRTLIDNIQKLCIMENKMLTLRDIKAISKEKKDLQPDKVELVNKIIKECRTQELTNKYCLEV